MKFTLLAILALYLPVRLRSQMNPPGELIIKKKCGSEHPRLWPDKSGKDLPKLFYAIRMLDSRPDTSRIGIVHNRYYQQQQIVLESPVASELSRYLNSSYASPKGSNL